MVTGFYCCAFEYFDFWVLFSGLGFLIVLCFILIFVVVAFMVFCLLLTWFWFMISSWVWLLVVCYFCFVVGLSDLLCLGYMSYLFVLVFMDFRFLPAVFWGLMLLCYLFLYLLVFAVGDWLDVMLMKRCGFRFCSLLCFECFYVLELMYVGLLRWFNVRWLVWCFVSVFGVGVLIWLFFNLSLFLLVDCCLWDLWF